MHNHHVETLHIRDVDAQDLSHSLVKKDRSDTEFSAATNDLGDQVAFSHALPPRLAYSSKIEYLYIEGK